MNEQEQAATAEAANSPVTAGALLRQAREASGLHIAALAVSLKVPVKKLEALEADRYELLPDAVFARALAASVCRTLRIDPAPILSRLPQNATPRLARISGSINTPFRSAGEGPGPSVLSHLSRPAVLAVLVLLLGAIVLIFLPDIKRQELSAGSSTGKADTGSLPVPLVATSPETAGLNPTAESAVPGSGSSEPAASRVGLAADGTAPSPTDGASLSQALSPQTGANAATAIAVPADAAGMPSSSASAPLVQGLATGIVTFKADGPSWVEVTDARGAVPLRKTLSAGEAVGASGALPLTVIVGKADSTQVLVRGKPLNLAPLSRDNVARFEVK